MWGYLPLFLCFRWPYIYIKSYSGRILGTLWCFINSYMGWITWGYVTYKQYGWIFSNLVQKFALKAKSFCLTWIIATYQSLNIAQWQVTLYTTKTWTLGLEFDKIYIGCNSIMYKYHVHEPRIKFWYTKQLQEIKTKAPSLATWKWR